MRYVCVKACADEYPVARVCAVLKVSESGYYAWLKRPQANGSKPTKASRNELF